MPSLKDLRNRIGSVKNTRKITTAMKMVAAGKLRRAQEQAVAAQPYAQAMARMLARVSGSSAGDLPPLLIGTGRSDVQLIVVMAADRGLAGGFNAHVTREARRQIALLLKTGHQVKLITVGKKARDALRREYGALIVHHIEEFSKPRLEFTTAEQLAQKILELFERHEFDACKLIFNKFVNVLVQKPTLQQIIPFELPKEKANDNNAKNTASDVYDFEPGADEILSALLPRNVAMQTYSAMLDNAAGEQAARMTAMDNATRNAGEMVKKLTLNYNRARQAFITRELIEIISGAEAV
jgi:F-type H+-transporting ATPase subunit gamma